MATHMGARLVDDHPDPVIHIALTPARDHAFSIGSTTEAVRIAQALGCYVLGFKDEELPPAVPPSDSPPCPILFRDGRTRLGRLYKSFKLGVDDLKADLKTLGISFFPAPVAGPPLSS
jgi:hypothetical protein